MEPKKGAEIAVCINYNLNAGSLGQTCEISKDATLKRAFKGKNLLPRPLVGRRMNLGLILHKVQSSVPALQTPESP